MQAARTLARAAAGGDPHPLSSSALQAALGAAGVVDPAPAAVVLSARAASLPEALAAASRFRGATHVGIGVVVRDDLAWAVLLASERRAELDPFPRRLAPGSTARLQRAPARPRRPAGLGRDPVRSGLRGPGRVRGAPVLRLGPLLRARYLACRGGRNRRARPVRGGRPRGRLRRGRSASTSPGRPRPAGPGRGRGPHPFGRERAAGAPGPPLLAGRLRARRAGAAPQRGHARRRHGGPPPGGRRGSLHPPRGGRHSASGRVGRTWRAGTTHPTRTGPWWRARPTWPTCSHRKCS